MGRPNPPSRDIRPIFTGLARLQSAPPLSISGAGKEIGLRSVFPTPRACPGTVNIGLEICPRLKGG